MHVLKDGWFTPIQLSHIRQLLIIFIETRVRMYMNYIYTISQCTSEVDMNVCLHSSVNNKKRVRNITNRLTSNSNSNSSKRIAMKDINMAVTSNNSTLDMPVENTNRMPSVISVANTSAHANIIPPVLEIVGVTPQEVVWNQSTLKGFDDAFHTYDDTSSDSNNSNEYTDEEEDEEVEEEEY